MAIRASLPLRLACTLPWLALALVCPVTASNKLPLRHGQSVSREVPVTQQAVAVTQAARPPPSSSPSPSRPAASSAVNPIDSCWATDAAWATNRTRLASCVRGYGGATRGGAAGRIYTVTTTADDPVNPPVGSLRYGVTRDEPLWIVFARDLTFTLGTEIYINSHKTIDARGAKVAFLNSACFELADVTNVIIHGISFTKCVRRTTRRQIRVSANQVRTVGVSSGDSITVVGSANIWIDHCLFDNTGYWEEDKHIVVKLGSRAITISNCKFQNMNKVILLSHDDSETGDRSMTVTLMLNFFGQKLTQRLPRCRFGNFHIVNNYYPFGWGMYAVGGSASPTILSENNHYVGATSKKEVTGRQVEGNVDFSGWNWKSKGDKFDMGAYFAGSGKQALLVVPYTYTALPAEQVKTATIKAGPMGCVVGAKCV